MIPFLPLITSINIQSLRLPSSSVIFNSQYLLLHHLQLDLFTQSPICVPSTSSNTPAVASTKKRVWSPAPIKTLLPARELKSNLVNELASGALVTVAKVASDVSYIFSVLKRMALHRVWLTRYSRHSMTRGSRRP